MKPQRIVVAMLDGFDPAYFQPQVVPELSRMAQEGFSCTVTGMFPSVTNVNNVSIITGAWPSEHGIVANSVFDEATGQAVYLNTGVRGESLFTRARSQGVRSALLTSKKKTKELFIGQADFVLAAEDLSVEERVLFGEAPPIYSREINQWLWETAYTLLDRHPEYGVIYVHITDYPMHAWPPEHPESQAHLASIDAVLGRIRRNHSDAAIFATADHGMNFKTRCWDLTRVLAAAGLPVRFVLSPERDYYVRHHRNFTGCAWLWLNQPGDREAVRQQLLGLTGVEAVRDSAEVAEEYHLDPARMGDLVVFGDRDTMFGDMDTEYEDLPAEYRAHGSCHEMTLPLIIWNYKGSLPAPGEFRHNKDLTAFLFR